MTAKPKSHHRHEDLTILFEIRNRFDHDHALTKLEILKRLDSVLTLSAEQIRRLHTCLCFVRAFPDSIAHYRLATEHLTNFEKRINCLSARERERLRDSGIAGTKVHFHNSYSVVKWMLQRAPGKVTLDWKELRNPTDMDAIVEHLLQPVEVEFFESNLVSTREWIDLAASSSQQTRFEWLFGQMEGTGRKIAQEAVWARLFDQADPALIWALNGSPYSKTLNTFPIGKVCPRTQGMRRSIGNARTEILKPLRRIRKLPARAGSQLIDRAMASLTVRHRETYHFNYANPREVYLADVGQGVNIAVFGLLPEHRFALECTMGYLVLANGCPVGYGGASVVFRQVNTGVNVFDEYRGSEAAFFWVQVMRVYRQLSGCTRFIANPYQLGGDGNDEALKSGAFWFYYRLGYRPTSRDIRELAMAEWRQMQSNGAYRSSQRALRQLASCDMHLALPGARPGELFEERWLETSSSLATRALAEIGGPDRSVSADRVLYALAGEIGLRGVRRWSPAKRRAASGLASVVMALNPSAWPTEAKDLMRSLLSLKGSDNEAPYASMLASQTHFLTKLRLACRAHEKVLDERAHAK